MDHSGVDPCPHTRLLIDRIQRITLHRRRTAELQTLASAAYSLRATHGRGRELARGRLKVETTRQSGEVS